MAPFNRRPKVSNHALQPANSTKVPRAPWDREDDDEFGAPPALDLSPGDAESEAKRMVYEKKHPLHDAVTQSGHINHNHAMRRYSSLMRRAWDPAARSIPVQPARNPANTDDRAGGTIQPPSAHTPLVPTGARTRVVGTPIATNDSTRAVANSPIAPDVAPSNVPLHPKDNRLRKAGGTQIPQTTPPDGSAGAHTDAPTQPTRLSDEDLASLSPEALADRTEGARQAQQRVLAAQRGAESATLPPYAIPYSTFLEAKEAIESRDDLSDIARNVMLGLIGYEDLSHDTGGGSSAGITTATFDNYKQIVSQLRIKRRDGPIVAESVSDLSTEELLDFQYVYLVVELDPDIRYSSEGPAAFAVRVADSKVFERIGSGAIAFQIADCVFNYNPKNGIKILQSAFNNAITRMPDEYREAHGYEMLNVDGDFGELTSPGIAALANDSRYKGLFLDWIRIERTRHNIGQGSYTGNNRWRIWGISRPHAGG
ncbi:MAG: hypothetical protein WD044_16170 [Dongiaceae bacterium]